MFSRQDRLIHWLLGSLELDTTLFHLGQYCGSWKASISGLARSGFHLVLHGQCWLHLPQEAAPRPLQAGDAVFFLRDVPHTLSPLADPAQAAMLHQGARGYLRQATAQRRLREAYFVAIVTPSLKHLRHELARRGA